MSQSPPKALFLRTTWAKSEFSAALRRSHFLEDCQETGTCPSRNSDCAGCVTIENIQYLQDIQDILGELDEDEIQDEEEQN